jgi:fumarate reductase flavoprotein subunit
VVPTAHYMMGGVEFNTDASTAVPGLFAAGEDCGGVHGANRLGGNGVANSTVFGGIAGDSMAAYVVTVSQHRDADEAMITAAVMEAEHPFIKPAQSSHDLRDALAQTMWDDVGIMRDEASLKRGEERLEDYASAIMDIGVADGAREFNLTWHDWLNVKSLVTISQVIAKAARAREDSRGAHFREDFPTTGDLETTKYTSIHKSGDALVLNLKPVDFSIVKPGESLIEGPIGAPSTHVAE